MLKLILRADAKSEQVLKDRLPRIIDAIEILAPDQCSDSLTVHNALDSATSRRAQYLTIGVVVSATGEFSADRLKWLRGQCLGDSRTDSVFVLRPRTTDFTGFEIWCASRLKAMLHDAYGEYAASQLAVAEFRQRTMRLEQSLAQAEAIFIEFRREPLKIVYRAERAAGFALPLKGPGGGPLQSLEVRQAVLRPIANVHYIDVLFDGIGRDVEGTVRLTAHGAWSGTVLCDTITPIQDLGRGWVQFRCARTEGGDAEPLVVDLRMTGPDLGWIAPAFAEASQTAAEWAVIPDFDPIGRPLAMQIWSGIEGIEMPPHAGAIGSSVNDNAEIVLGVAAEKLGMAKLVSKLPPGLTFAPVSYDAATQSLLVHPLGRRPTVARLPPLRVPNLMRLSATVQVTDPKAKPTEFALLALPATDLSDTVPDADDLDVSGISWHQLNARECRDIEVSLPEPLAGEVRIYLLTRTRSDDWDYTSAWFRGLRMICSPAVTAEQAAQ